MCEGLRNYAESVKFTKKCEKCEKCENEPNFINISLDFIRVFAYGAFFVDFPKKYVNLEEFYENLENHISSVKIIFCKIHVKTINSRFFMSKTSMSKIPYKVQ